MTTRSARDEHADRYGVARAALAEIPLAVIVVGAAHEDGRSCATATAMYVSFAPPRVAIALHPGSRTCAMVEASGRFSLSMLHERQMDIAMAAGRGGPGDDKFAALGIATVEASAEGSPPGVAGSTAVLWCSVVERHTVGDHTMFLGEVEEYAVDDAPVVPLLRHRRRYAAMGQALSDPAPEGYPT